MVQVFSAGRKWGIGLAHQEMVKAHIEAFQIEYPPDPTQTIRRRTFVFKVPVYGSLQSLAAVLGAFQRWKMRAFWFCPAIIHLFIVQSPPPSLFPTKGLRLPHPDHLWQNRKRSFPLAALCLELQIRIDQRVVSEYID